MDLFGLQQRHHHVKTSGTTCHEYKKVYRFSEQHIILMANIFLGETYEQRGHSLTRKEKLVFFLRYVGDPGYQINVCEKISINQSTISRVILEIAEKIASKCKDYIHFPTTAEELQEAQQNWGMRFTHPYAIGVIDGTYLSVSTITLSRRISFHQCSCDMNDMKNSQRLTSNVTRSGSRIHFSCF
jgi:hypothetical protein